ncbi:MAG: pyridoxal phosphate-dependent aminotransferase [Candidatus Scalinduaceae bacterium]
MLNGHGGNINKICNAYGIDPDEIIDFSASINPLGYPDSVRKVILKRFNDILNYPDSECTDLRKSIAKKHSCKESNIIIGNGSNELFHLIPRALKPIQGAVLQPTFSEFKDALYNANVNIIEIIYDINKEFTHYQAKNHPYTPPPHPAKLCPTPIPCFRKEALGDRRAFGRVQRRNLENDSFTSPLSPPSQGGDKGEVVKPDKAELSSCRNSPDIEQLQNKSFSFDLNDARLRNLREGVVFLCNPNNPTGQLVTKQEILEFAKDYPKRLIVVDEAFMDFVEEEEEFTVIKEASPMENLIVVRSLTKFYGFPGLRLGYLVACESIINNLLRFKEPWTVNSLAQVAGQVAINDEMFILNTRSFMSIEKRFLYECLSKIEGLNPLYPSANFILVRIENGEITSSRIHDLLLKDKIIIRDCSNFIGLSDKYFRVAVRTREENQKLLNALKGIISCQTAEVASEEEFTFMIKGDSTCKQRQ